MDSLEKTAAGINENLGNLYSKATASERTVYIMNQLKYLLDDAFKLVKNINETSLPGKDRTDRLIEIESKLGIPKTHLL